ncbi:EXS family-domain-containing protein [Gongronella butleri]|nr:EXS family-domain-containing protein [Gongronella butleri]
MDQDFAWLAGFYRPLFLVCIGLWGWGLDLLVLARHRIDACLLLQIHPSDKHPYKAIFALSFTVSAVVLLNMAMYGELALTSEPSWLPLGAYLSAMVILFWPGQGLYRQERTRFIRLVRRVFSLNLFSTVYFADIIFADLLTSFSNVFGDLFLALCIIIPGKSSDDYHQLESNTENACYRDILVPFIISVPYIIRFRQCLSEYLESKCETKRHLFNAMKYASAFPVIILSAMQKKASLYIANADLIPPSRASDTNLFKLWMVAVFFNSMFSFWWDIAMDWSLIQVTYEHLTAKHASIGLHQHHQSATPMIRFRRHMHFSSTSVYFFAMMLDFVLRITWSLKLSSNMYFQQVAGSIFLLELLEVARRWLWIIFRLESEWVKRGTLPTSASEAAYVARRSSSPSAVNTNLPGTNDDIQLLDRPSKTLLTPIREEGPDDDTSFMVEKQPHHHPL